MEAPSADVNHAPIVVLNEPQVRALVALDDLYDLLDPVGVVLIRQDGDVPATTSFSLRRCPPDPLLAGLVRLGERERL